MTPPPAPTPPVAAPAPARPASGWEGLLPAGRTAVMGVLNVTPDSFSDGGRFVDTGAAVAHAARLVAQGADLLDIGGESTRPGAPEVPEGDEIQRVVPVITALRAAGIDTPITIDTRKAAVARAAVQAGASAVNDVSALRHDPRMAETCADLGVPVALMHMRGTPQTMQEAPVYGSVVAEVSAWLEARMDAAVAAGIGRHRLCVDPGIGFGKTVRHNLLLLKGLNQFTRLGVPLLVGTSRKSFIGTLLEEPDPARREWGTAATVTWAVAHGARIVRVHQVAEMAQVVRLADAIRSA